MYWYILGFYLIKDNIKSYPTNSFFICILFILYVFCIK